MNLRPAFLLFVLFASGVARADVLELGLSGLGEGAAAPVIWGQLNKGTLLIGGDVLKLEAAPADAVVAAKVEPVAPAPVAVAPRENGPVAATYELRAGERAACVRSARFQSLLELLKILKSKVRAVVLRGDDGWDACAAEAGKKLQGIGIALEREKGGRAELVVELVGTSSAKAVENASSGTASGASSKTGAVTPMATLTPTPTPTAKADVGVGDNVSVGMGAGAKASTKASLIIAGQPVPLDPSGYFILQRDTFAPVMLTLTAPGYRAFKREITPWPVAAGERPAPSASGVRLLRAVATSGEPTIKVIPETPGAHEAVFDLVAGGGISYGHELPNETRGKRFAVAASYTRRDLFYGLGVRGALSATVAGGSVVPWTLFADALLTHTGELLDESGSWRAGVGTRVFAAKVQQQRQRGLAVIPDQVVAPVVELAGEQRLGPVLLALRVDESALYLPGAGVTSALSPDLAVGYVIADAGALLLGFRADVVKYPTVGADAALHLDTTYLIWRQGL